MRYLDNCLVGKCIRALSLEVCPLLVRVSPLFYLFLQEHSLLLALLAVKSEAPWLHELEALAAHDSTVKVCMESECQRSMLHKAQHGLLGEVSMLILFFTLDAVSKQKTSHLAMPSSSFQRSPWLHP
jgi:hypothetical protein